MIQDLSWLGEEKPNPLVSRRRYCHGKPINDPGLAKLWDLIEHFRAAQVLPLIPVDKLGKYGVTRYESFGLMIGDGIPDDVCVPILGGKIWDWLFIFSYWDIAEVAIGYYLSPNAHGSGRFPVAVGMVYNEEQPKLDDLVKMLLAWRRLVLFGTTSVGMTTTVEAAVAVNAG